MGILFQSRRVLLEGGAEALAIGRRDTGMAGAISGSFCDGVPFPPITAIRSRLVALISPSTNQLVKHFFLPPMDMAN